MDLKTAVERYLEVVKEFRRPMALAEFGLSRQETEAMVSAWDEDYHLHRHFELIPAKPESEPREPASLVPSAVEGSRVGRSGSGQAGSIGAEASYLINGFSYTAIVFLESIRHVLGHTLE